MVINQKLLHNVIVEFWIGYSVYDYVKYFKFSFTYCKHRITLARFLIAVS